MEAPRCTTVPAPSAGLRALKWNGKYCTPLCHSRAHERRRPSRPGRQFLRRCRSCGADHRASSASVYCSIECRQFKDSPSTPVPWAECEWCGHRFINRTNRRYCTRTCAARSEPRRCKPQPIEYGHCQRCGRLFIRRGGQLGACCSDACIKRLRKNHRKHLHRTATRLGETVTIQYLGHRDHWTCQLCGKKVKRDAAVPHPAAPTIDHVIPLARGGEHTRANTQLAHFLCNSLKHVSAANEQLRLIG